MDEWMDGWGPLEKRKGQKRTTDRCRMKFFYFFVLTKFCFSLRKKRSGVFFSESEENKNKDNRHNPLTVNIDFSLSFVELPTKHFTIF